MVNIMRSKNLITLLKVLITLGVYLSANYTLASELSASVNRTTISIQETLTLTIELNEQSLMSEPDFSGLSKDFDILSTSKSSNINLINGKFKGTTQWNLELMPKRSGKLIIPSFKLNNIKSKTIIINVSETPIQSKSSQKHDDIFVETTASKNEVYIQEQLFFTVRLYHQSQQIRNWSLSEPNIKDAHVISYEEPKQYYAMVDGLRYGVLERNYVIFPEKSGSLLLPVIRFNGIVSEASSSRSRYNFNQGKRVIRDSKPININIKSVPDSFKGKVWFPASNVSIEDSWSPDKMRFDAGEPVTRTITVIANGALGSHIPPIVARYSQSIKQYPDQANISDELKTNGAVGKRIESTALIPLKQEEINLPTVRIPWWDTDEDKMKYATLSSRKLSVSAETPSINQAPVPLADEPSIQQHTQTPSLPGASEKEENVFTIWQAISVGSLFFNLLLILFLFIFWQSNKKRDDISNQKRSQEKNSKKKQLKLIEKNILKACSSNDAKTARKNLIEWVQVFFDDQSLYSLDKVAERLDDENLIKCVHKLENSLYGHSGKLDWNGENLAMALKGLPKINNKAKKGKSDLPEIYPISS